MNATIPPNFVPGLTLAQQFYQTLVQPALKTNWPHLPYTAALLGDGSEVLGFDTPRSMDHDWGPRLYLFLSESDFALAHEIVNYFEQQLPTHFMGHRIAFADPDRAQGFSSQSQSCGSVDHGIECFEITSFLTRYLGQHPAQITTPQAWLSIPEALLGSVTAGAVFHDELGLETWRSELAYYPHDLWLHIMACQWVRIAQEEAFVGRCDEVEDHLGAQIITARLVRDLMRLTLMQNKRYIPYSKWLGSAFAQCPEAKVLSPLMQQALKAEHFKARERLLSEIYRNVANQHNTLHLTPPLPPETSFFHDRPYQVIHGYRFATALWQAIQAPAVKAIHSARGSVSQWTDSTDVLSHPDFCAQFKSLE